MAPVTISSLAGLSKIDLNNILKGISKQDFTALFDDVAMRGVFKKLDVDQKTSLLNSLDESDKIKILNKLDPADRAILVNKVDLVDDSSKIIKADQISKADKLAIVGSAAAIGAFIYLDDKAATESKKVKKCVGTCLPSNWDDHEYGSLEKGKLSFRTLDSLKTEFPDENIEPSQPVCTATIEDCGSFCSTKCKSLHETALPGGSLLNRTIEDTIDIVDKVNPFKLLFGDMGGYAWLPLLLMVIFVVFFIFIF
jgi:hypothetical protein